jgi:hypothetical protein
MDVNGPGRQCKKKKKKEEEEEGYRGKTPEKMLTEKRK